MRPLLTKLTPSRGISQILHTGYNILLPLLIYVLVRLGSGFIGVAFSLIILSKWRMFAVRPRFWIANIRANAIDMLFGVSILAFMTATTSTWAQLFWAATWAVWLIILKPKTSILWMSLQAVISFVTSLSALFLTYDHAPLAGLVVATGVICYVAAHHFLYSFEEPYTRLLAFTWGYFGAALTWILGHWLLFYGPVAQPTLLLGSLGLGVGTLYYLDHHDRLQAVLRRQFIFIMMAIALVVLVFSDWGDKLV